jgi:hypothetical protein
VALLTWIGLGSFLLVSVLVGARLLLLWRRTRELPELSMGLAFSLAAALGYPMTVAASSLHGAAASGLAALGMLAISTGSGALAFFNWRVFRDQRSGACLFTVLVGAMAFAWIATVVDGGFGHADSRSWDGWTGLIARVAIYGWCGFEALRYWLLMRRRVAIGLAEPELVARFLWWAVGSAAAMGIFVHTGIMHLLGLPPDPTAPLSALPTVVLGLASAISIGSAFRRSSPVLEA